MSLSIGSKWMSTFTLNEYVITEVEKKWLGTSMVYLRADGDFVLANSLFLREFAPRPN